MEKTVKNDNVAIVATLDNILVKAQNLKRKLETLHREEQSLQKQQARRVGHLQDLYDIESVSDVKFDDWSNIRLDRMLVDYMLRHNYNKSAKKFTEQRQISDLVDIEAFSAFAEVEQALKQGRTSEAIAWCNENKKALKDVESKLELELRLQQMVEMTRFGNTNKLVEATLHARKYFAGQQNESYGLRAGGLLAYPANTLTEPYKVSEEVFRSLVLMTYSMQDLYSSTRYVYLASLFVEAYHQIFCLPPQPLLHIALSAGLSALKTPSCHSAFTSSSTNASSTTTSVCPICSTELNELARNVPYAHHSKSHVENDPVILPNGRIYGRERLMALNDKFGVAAGRVRDPINHGQEYDIDQIEKVYIS